MLNFAMPIQGLMDYQKCYEYLEALLHPNGLHCSQGHCLVEKQRPHKFRKNGLPCYKCYDCGQVYNLFTDSIFKGVHYDCIRIVLMLRGFAQGTTTLLLSKELGMSYNELLAWRHKLQEFAFENRSVFTLTDTEVESDEMFQNAGEKGHRHECPDDPARVRANLCTVGT